MRAILALGLFISLSSRANSGEEPTLSLRSFALRERAHSLECGD